MALRRIFFFKSTSFRVGRIVPETGRFLIFCNPKIRYMEKEKILESARKHVASVCERIMNEKTKLVQLVSKAKQDLKSVRSADVVVEHRILQYNEKRLGELAHLEGSPYFVRCDVVWDGEKETKSIYFGKFGFGDEEIYSWITPASQMRFENPGAVEYERPDGKMQKAQMLRKDQYMIVNGKVKFLATEEVGKARELIYQEYFSNRKTGFVLPEIVAQMEKAQDQVIRAHHVGSFLISGPAGSGKTTLALHRVAYLVQSPDLANIYASDSIIVFVQDNGTKEYFSQLLPELGIDDVLITTFSEWALQILSLDLQYAIRYGTDEKEKDAYEFQKIKAMRHAKIGEFSKRSAYAVLENIYFPYFSPEQKRLFSRQKKEKKLDRIDLVILLKAYLNTNESLGVIKDQYIEMKNGLIRKKRGFVPLEYSLAVMDEFQNYLPEQLSLIKSCISSKARSMLYVGDMAQQVRLGTIRDWQQIGENIEGERKVVLQKVYRNTKNILEYIKSLGYAIEIPEGIKEGKEVAEMSCESLDEEISYINKIIDNLDGGSVGVLAKEENKLLKLREAFSANDKVHAMTMHEAQGVEFDAVCLVGMDFAAMRAKENIDFADELTREKSRIDRDLLYVALTRAISELHVLGE